MTQEAFDALKAKYPKLNEPWTGDEETELRKMAEDGVPTAAMSNQLQRTPGAVRYKLRSMGLLPPPHPTAKPWTTEDDTALVTCYRAGDSFASMAEHFGRSEKAIVSRLVRLRLNLFHA